MYTMDTYKDEIVLKLGGGIVDVEIEPVLDKIILSSFREIKPYLNHTEVLTLPYAPKMDLSAYNVEKVDLVMRDVSTSTNSGYPDALYLAAGVVTGTPYDFSAYQRLMTLRQIKNTISTDLDYIYIKPYLYVNQSTASSPVLTIMYTPDYQNINELQDHYWVNLLMQLVLAQSKVILGRVYSKYSLNNAIWDINGADLIQSGEVELDKIRETLENGLDTLLPLD